MLIHEFHSKLVSRKEQSVLFKALRKLRLWQGPQRMTAADPGGDGGDNGDGGDDLAGWPVWSDASGSGGHGCSVADGAR